MSVRIEDSTTSRLSDSTFCIQVELHHAQVAESAAAVRRELGVPVWNTASHAPAKTGLAHGRSIMRASGREQNLPESGRLARPTPHAPPREARGEASRPQRLVARWHANGPRSQSAGVTACTADS